MASNPLLLRQPGGCLQDDLDTHTKLLAWGVKASTIHGLQRKYGRNTVPTVEADPFLAIREGGGSYE